MSFSVMMSLPGKRTKGFHASCYEVKTFFRISCFPKLNGLVFEIEDYIKALKLLSVVCAIELSFTGFILRAVWRGLGIAWETADFLLRHQRVSHEMRVELICRV